MLDARVAGESDPAVMAELAKGRLREQRDLRVKALSGRVKAHQRFILGELLCQIDALDESIARFSQQIESHCAPFDEAVKLLATIPGVGRETAQVIVAEMGSDMSRFPSADHLAAWAGLAPGNHESAGKRLSSQWRRGNQAWCTSLIQAAHAAAHTKATYLSAQYRRLATRRGKYKAIVAVGHSILVIAYHLIKRHQPYQELGGDYFDQHSSDKTKNRLVHRLEKLGYQVSLQAASEAVAA